MARSLCFCRMRRPDSEQLFTKLGDEFERNSQYLSAVAAERVINFTGKSDDVLLLANDYRVSKKILERKLLEQELIVKVMTALVRQLEKNMLFTRRNIFLQKTNEKLIRWSCEQKSVAGRSVAKLVKNAGTRFVGTVICIIRAIPKCCSARDIGTEPFHRTYSLELNRTVRAKF